MRFNFWQVSRILVATTLIIACRADSPKDFPPPAGLSTVSDDYAGSVLDLEKWEVRAASGGVVVDNRLELVTTAGVNHHTVVRNRLPLGFLGNTFFAEISAFSQGSATTETFVGVSKDDEDEYVVISAWGGQLTAWYKWRGGGFVQLPGTFALNPIAHRFLRLREQGGVVYYETSPSGQTWTVGWSTVHRFSDAARLLGYVGVGTWASPNNNPTHAFFENVNTRMPAAPRGLVAAAGAPLSIDLAWQDRSVNETGFEIQRSAAGSGVFEPLVIVAPNITAYSDGGLTEGTTYEYRVRASGTDSASAFADVASATAVRKPAPPPAPPPPVSSISDPFVGTTLDLGRRVPPM